MNPIPLSQPIRLEYVSFREMKTTTTTTTAAAAAAAAAAAVQSAVTLSNITRSARQLLTLSNRKRFLFAGF